jgi:hypothetical protein
VQLCAIPAILGWILYVKIQHSVGQNLASSRYTHVLIAKPDIDLYASFRDIKGLQGLQVQLIQEVKTSEALTFVFKTDKALSAEAVGDILHTPGAWHISANLDGTLPQVL